jgi:hypothetical protein
VVVLGEAYIALGLIEPIDCLRKNIRKKMPFQKKFKKAKNR